MNKHLTHLIAPFEHILLPVFHFVVDVEELHNAVFPDVVGIFLGFGPVKRGALRQQAH